MKKKAVQFLMVLTALLVVLAGCGNGKSTETAGKDSSVSKNDSKKSVELLNVSYDPTRELYQEFNKSFSSYWKANTGQDVTTKQAHPGSGKKGSAVCGA